VENGPPGKESRKASRLGRQLLAARPGILTICEVYDVWDVPSRRAGHRHARRQSAVRILVRDLAGAARLAAGRAPRRRLLSKAGAFILIGALVIALIALFLVAFLVYAALGALLEFAGIEVLALKSIGPAGVVSIDSAPS
jgi:hypothetical protein